MKTEPERKSYYFTPILNLLEGSVWQQFVKEQVVAKFPDDSEAHAVARNVAEMSAQHLLRTCYAVGLIVEFRELGEGKQRGEGEIIFLSNSPRNLPLSREFSHVLSIFTRDWDVFLYFPPE